MVQPFLKWAGGKRWLVKNHADLFPQKFNRYYEPFLGSGAVFFHLEPKEAVLSDANPHLIETYQAIKDDWRQVLYYLKKHQRNHSKDYYYQIRGRNCLTKHTRAAKFIYLNRTCFNGIYRENLKGIFNVPIGTKTAVILNTDDFEETSRLLKYVDLKHWDFAKSVTNAKEGDFIFVDPPYTVAHNNNGFVKYNQKIFSWDDQVRLHESLCKAKDRGALIVLTNADHPSIHSLYNRCGSISTRSRLSVIGGKGSTRGKESEMILQW